MCHDTVSMEPLKLRRFRAIFHVCYKSPLFTHRVHIIEANGESYRLKDARKRRKKPRGG